MLIIYLQCRSYRQQLAATRGAAAGRGPCRCGGAAAAAGFAAHHASKGSSLLTLCVMISSAIAGKDHCPSDSHQTSPQSIEIKLIN